ncbi:hypothetical protein BU23DRAFT_556718 [Bimuria novae-zelandiae CBS 107.79]|uniref:Secreted protein n=1 Tax=Bimuria novae-zelandiae CBS 107.79 TaxID=1447943 RepID=A0A6A5V2L8_9PLEO|nr:hypothetical protein BU23DRAFT_556718 [Bimuria novae-zelandiae CBS 107.79]
MSSNTIVLCTIGPLLAFVATPPDGSTVITSIAIPAAQDQPQPVDPSIAPDQSRGRQRQVEDKIWRPLPDLHCLKAKNGDSVDTLF